MNWWKIDIKGTIAEYLGQLFSGLQKLVYVLFYPLELSWKEYEAWRDRQYYLINVTGQVLSLQGHLNDEFDPTLRRIKIHITPPNTLGTFVAKETEETPFLAVGLSAENEPGVFVGSTTDINHFTVDAPAALSDNSERIKDTVNQFRLAGKKYLLQFS